MTTGKFDITTIGLTMALLYIGALLSGFATPFLPVTGWIQGFFIALIQALLLSMVGLLTGKMGLWNLAITAVLIMVGALAGGYIAEFVGFSGLWLTVTVLAIQTFFLIFTGFIGKKKAKL